MSLNDAIAHFGEFAVLNVAKVPGGFFEQTEEVEV